MKQITVSYFKIETGRLYYSDLEEILFRNVEWTELTRDEVSNFETWQWIPSKLVFCVKSVGKKKSSLLALYTKSTPRKLSMGLSHLINWSRKLSMCNVCLNNQERSPWVLYQISKRAVGVRIVLKYYVIYWFTNILHEHCMHTQVTKQILLVRIRCASLSKAMCVVSTPRTFYT